MDGCTANLNLDQCRIGVILKDGSSILFRPIRKDDEERLIDFVSRLSANSVYLRFHRAMDRLSREQARQLCNIDYEKAFALAAVHGEGEEEKIVAVGRYARLENSDAAEVAFTVEDKYQGKGIGTRLLEQLAQTARGQGIRRFEGLILGQNREMIKLLRDSGFQVEQELEQGIYHMVMNIAPTPLVAESFANREKAAALAALRVFLKPSSIAVIGASRRTGTIGNQLFHNLLLRGFPGPVYPVNPNAAVVSSVKAYPSILEVPGEVDLALVVVPADLVQSMVEQCGRKGVRGIVVISAGFGESGVGGAEKQKQIVEVARRYGMRLVGPNCMGVINTDPEVNLDATFAPVFPPAGNIAMCSQSGALGIAILEYAKSLNLGLSSFISIGNRADVSNNDLIQYWEDDPATKIILLYLESFGDPREFGRVARRVAAAKPIVVVKSGRTAAGKRAAASHTGALASAEVASEALFRQAGIIRVDTLEELFDVANLLSHQPIPRGRRVAVLTNGGGPGIMTADACSSRGLELPLLSEKTASRLKKILPRGAALTNPVDMTAEAGKDEYRKVLKIFLEEDYIDIVIVIFIPPIVTHPEEVAQAIREMAPAFRRQGKTVVASFMGARGISWDLGSQAEGYIPSFTFPEATATVLAKACEYGDWVKKPKGTFPRFEDTNKEKVEEIIQKALSSDPGRPVWLEAAATLELLGHYGIRTAPSRLAVTMGQAALAAREIGFPVAIKLLSRTITHKTEVGGVKVNLKSESEVEQAFLDLREHLSRLGRAAEMQGVIVQKMVPSGIEVIVGVTQDPSFGPLLMFGLGGIYAELFKDVAFRLHPLTDIDSQEMVRSVKTYELLKGWRGAPPSDISSVEKLLCRISALIEDHPRIAELDLNPVIVQEEGQGCQVVDARILIN